MRHRRATNKLGRKTEHRRALIANQVCSLIEHESIRTTLAKAKAVRPFAERVVTMGKVGTLHARRRALAFLRNKQATKRLFEKIVPLCADRQGGYTRIIKLGPRLSDAAPLAILEWVHLKKREPRTKRPRADTTAAAAPSADAAPGGTTPAQDEPPAQEASGAASA